MGLALAPLWLPAYRRLLSAYALAELSWGLSSVALTVLVFERTGDSLGTTALFLISLTIPALAAPGLTARLERLPTRRALVWLYVAEAAMFGALAVIAGKSPLPLVLALAFLDGAAGLAARALARASAAAILEPRGLLREGNALTNLAFGVVYMIAPAIGGLAVAQFGARTALGLTAGSFALMALVLATGPQLAGGLAPGGGWWTLTRGALAHVRERAMARRLLTAQAVGLVFFSLIGPIEIVYAGRDLHGGPGAYGALLSAWGGGSLVGGLLYARLRHADLGRLVWIGTALVGVGYLAMAGAPSVVTACAGAALGGLGNGVQFVALITAVQEAIAEAYRARVMALLESLGAAAPGLGFVLGGAITTLANPRVTFLVAGAGAVAVAALLALRLPHSPTTRPPAPGTRVDPDATAIPAPTSPR